MTDLHQTVLARLRTSGDEGLPFWALRPLHESGGAVQEALRDLEASSRITRDPETERYRLVDDAPVTEPTDTLHGLPASLVDVRILTLDDVAEPLPHALPSMPVPPRGHPAHGVGPGWSERIAALEGALRLVDVALAGHTARIRDLEERLRAMGVEL